MNAADIARGRLHSQLIAGQHDHSLATMLQHMVALQAQDYYGCKWSVGLRLPGSCDADVEQAIARKEVIRTWSFRGTWHLMHPHDVRWILSLIGSRVLARAASNFRREGLGEKEIKNSRKLIAKALSGGQMTRAGLLQYIQDKGGNTTGLCGGFMLLDAALSGLICGGPRHDKEFTFVLLDDWLPGERVVANNNMLDELSLRYFMSHGPATVADLAYWSGISISEARQSVSRIKHKLDSCTDGNAAFYFAPGLMDARPLKSVHLLPGFDECLMGYRDRSQALPHHHKGKITPANNGMFNPTVLIDGAVQGMWKRTLAGDGVQIDITAFEDWGPALRKKIIKAGQAYAAFLALQPQISFLN